MKYRCMVPYKFLCMLLIYAVFLKSFFPIRKGLSGFSEVSDSSYEIFLNKQSDDRFQNKDHVRIFAQFDRLVFVLIDALRADFVFSKHSHMTKLNGLWREGKAMRYIARVHPPTVTLPRIKALTTGSIPGFVDVVLNFGSSALLEDNIVAQMKRAKKKVMFYGDDTWIKLFPDLFIKSDGTTSFIVTDYTEVDNNVTRHLTPSFQEDVFDVMILHYLGLDHIGHLAGPTSPLVPHKLQEMDNIIGDIYTHLQKNTSKKSLILLCGDHGMSDQGGHGGATPSETRVPVVLISPSFKLTSVEGRTLEVNQIDITPTLSLLLGLPIPKNNLGVIIESALQGFSLEEKVMALWKNALQVSKVLKYNNPNYDIDEGYIEYQRVTKIHQDWLLSKNNTTSRWSAEGHRIVKLYGRLIVTMVDSIASSLTQYDMYSLIVAIVGLWLILVTALEWTCISTPLSVGSLLHVVSVCLPVGLGVLLIHVVVCTSLTQSSLMCKTDILGLLLQGLIVTVLCLSSAELALAVFLFKSSQQTKTRGVRGCLSLYLVTGTVFHTLSLVSSSYVEEEHQTWYFYTVSIHLILLAYILGQYLTQVNVKDKTNDKSLRTSSCGVTEEVSYAEVVNESFSTDNEEISDAVDIRQNVHHVQLKNFPMRPVMSIILVLILCRVLRMWNQTGNKWLDTPDVGDWLVHPENKTILSLWVGVSLAVVGLLKWCQQSIVQRTLFITGLVFVYWYKAETGAVSLFIWQEETSKRMGIAQLTYVLVLSCIMEPAIKKISQHQISSSHITPGYVWRAVQSGWIVLVLLLIKPHNVIMFAMVITQEHLISHVILDTVRLSQSSLTLYYLWMGMAAFYYQGNSNSISTVDVSAGYVGLEDYQPLLVGVLMAVSTYGGPVFWLISLLKQESHGYTWQNKTRFKELCTTLCWTRALPLAVYTVLVTSQRYHLFVWTVFSPKLLYEGMWTVLVSMFCIFIVFIS